MDELGSAISMEQRSKVILSIKEKKIFLKQDNNREWVTLVECIYIINGDIPPFFIIKS